MINNILDRFFSILTFSKLKQLIPAVIIVYVLSISAVFVPKIALGSRFPLYLIILPFAVAFLILLLKFPVFSLTLLIVTSLAVPIAVSSGSQTPIYVAVLLLIGLIGLWILEMLIQNHRIEIIPSRPIRPLLLFTVMSIISFGFGQLSWFSTTSSAPLRAQVGGLLIFILSIGAFFLAAHRLKNDHDLSWLTYIFLFLGGLYIVARILPDVNIPYRWLFQDGSTGGLFWTWLVAIALSQAMINNHLSRKWRIALLLLVIGTFYAGFFMSRAWTSGWFPPLIAAIVILFIYKPRIGLLGLVMLLLIMLPNLGELTNVVMTGDNPYSLTTRVEAWTILYQIILRNPILGLGPANYYWYTPLYTIAGYYVPFNSHNNYVDMIAQVGFVGLFCFLWFAWEVGRLSWKIKDKVPDGFSKAYIYGAIGGLVGTLISGGFGDWVIPFVYNVGLDGFRTSMLGWLFLGGVVVLEQRLVKRNQEF